MKFEVKYDGHGRLLLRAIRSNGQVVEAEGKMAPAVLTADDRTFICFGEFYRGCIGDLQVDTVYEVKLPREAFVQRLGSVEVAPNFVPARVMASVPAGQLGEEDHEVKWTDIGARAENETGGQRYYTSLGRLMWGDWPAVIKLDGVKFTATDQKKDGGGDILSVTYSCSGLKDTVVIER